MKYKLLNGSNYCWRLFRKSWKSVRPCALVEEDNDKKTIIALREIGDGKLQINDLENNAVTRLGKEPDQTEELEEVEIEENDDFENLYKGQVSKSGVAILPSKRVRRVPENKSTKSNESNLVKEALSELKSEQPQIKEEELSEKNDEAPLELKEEVQKTD